MPEGPFLAAKLSGMSTEDAAAISGFSGGGRSSAYAPLAIVIFGYVTAAALNRAAMLIDRLGALTSPTVQHVALLAGLWLAAIALVAFKNARRDWHAIVEMGFASGGAWYCLDESHQLSGAAGFLSAVALTYLMSHGAAAWWDARQMISTRPTGAAIVTEYPSRAHGAEPKAPSRQPDAGAGRHQ
jgi:hypothetical protein